MKIVVVSSQYDLKDEVRKIIRLFKCGLQIFHLRKPELNINDFEDIIRNIPEKFHNRIVIHSHYQLLDKYKIKGVHLSEKKRKEFISGKSTDIKQNIKIISTSFHNPEDLLDYKEDFEYVFLSPLFDSISKPGYHSTFNLDYVSSIIKRSRFKVIALGGINSSNAFQAKNMGFYGVAVSGAIWQTRNYLKEFSKIEYDYKDVHRNL